MEKFKQIPVAPNYEISTLGTIKKTTKTPGPQSISIRTDKDGYEVTHLSVNGRQRYFRIHRLMAVTFLGESPMHVHHKNGVKSDNRLENLEYLTPAKNRWHGTNTLDSYKKGEAHGNSKLNSEQVEAIHLLRKNGWSGPKIGKVVGCTSANVYTILKGKGWGHIAPTLAYTSE
jgi:hypothetical protein